MWCRRASCGRQGLGVLVIADLNAALGLPSAATNEMVSLLRDKSTVVTGCSSAIGLAIARRLVNDGYAVVGIDVNPPPGNSGDVHFD